MRSTKTFLSFLAAALALLSISFAHAADTVCTTIQGASGPTTATLNIAVASNLWTPMIASGTTLANSGLVRNFLNTNSTDTIQVCHNATADLVAEITTGNNPKGFGLFLAANTAGATNVCNYAAGFCVAAGEDLAANPFSYIRGIPTLWSRDSGLINLSDGTINLSSANLTEVVIASPSAAPYGLAAQQIMQYKKQWNAVQNQLTVKDNIDLTYNYLNVENTGRVGFVAMSQICRQLSSLPPLGYYYNEYPTDSAVPPTAGYNPIIQNGTVINRPAPANSNDTAIAFVDFLLDSSASGGRTILTTKFCYQAP
jgi:molybdate transport system substrate-binding protein